MLYICSKDMDTKENKGKPCSVHRVGELASWSATVSERQVSRQIKIYPTV